MAKVERLREVLRSLPHEGWAAYLTEHSGLPGPRGDIELGQAFAEEADSDQVEEVLATDDEYLTFCGALGLGRELAEADSIALVDRLRGYAVDERWRVREAVAMALQRLGDADLPRLLTLATAWSADAEPLVQRAAAAGLCEPRLLASIEAAATAVAVCDRATRRLALLPAERRRDADVRALRKGLGYCWSVAVAADPAAGLPPFLALDEIEDTDVAWIARENRKKTRLVRAMAHGG